MGSVWQAIGIAENRTDVAAHGSELLTLAPLLYRDLHASLNQTVDTTASPGSRCYPSRVEGFGPLATGQMDATYRSYVSPAQVVDAMLGECHVRSPHLAKGMGAPCVVRQH